MATDPRILDRLELGTHELLGHADDLPLAPRADPTRTILQILSAACEFTHADVAYVGELSEQRQIIRWVSGDATTFGFRAGAAVPLVDVYCSRLLSGRLPGVIADTRADPRTRDMPITQQADIGAYIEVPIARADGTLFGTLCALSHEADPSLDEHHERFLSLMARLAAEEIAKSEAASRDRLLRADLERRTREASQSIRTALQPIVDLRDGWTVGFESLSRFADGRPPDQWLADAGRVELDLDVELAMIRAALRRMADLPQDAFLSINASPRAVLSESFGRLLKESERQRRLVLEITEHDEVADYKMLTEELARLRNDGIAIAVDDVGAGFASLRHVLYLAPDILKLDVSLTRGIDDDPARAALVSLLVSFATRIGATIVAEGIETDAECSTLTELGVPLGQGFLLGAPSESVYRIPMMDPSPIPGGKIEQPEQLAAPFIR